MKVNVVLPIYKPNQWLFEAIDSVVKQTYDDWILTIIDDASPDDSFEKVRKYLERKPKSITCKINLLKNDKNVGAAAARNKAVKSVQSDAICFIDQDDQYHPNKIEKQVKALKNKDVGLVFSNIIRIDEKGEYIGEGEGNNIRNNIDYENMSPKSLQRELSIVNSLRIGAVMVDRKAFLDVGCFDSSLFGGEEWEFWVRIASKYKFVQIPDNLYEKREHREQVSKEYNKERMYGDLVAIKKMSRFYPYLRNSLVNKKQGIIRRIVNLEMCAGNYKIARKLIKKEFHTIAPGLKDYVILFLTYTGPFGKILYSINNTIR